MNRENFIQAIKEPQSITQEEIQPLDQLVAQYPFFQTAQLLLTKGLHNTDSIRYNKQLKKAAAYSGNRKLLFSLISKNTVPKNKEDAILPDVTKSIEEQLALGKPLNFKEEETHSFSEWLALSKLKKIDRKSEKQQSTQQLVDTFIVQQPRIKKPENNDFFKAERVAKKSLIENEELVTETLARVYLEQGHYEKSIAAYKKLSLKYPKKNSFFAAQIKLINNLNK